jgi:hypothetical protein
VCGKESYECILKSKPDGHMVSPSNWYTGGSGGGYMYILNGALPDNSEAYGPFTMTDIWNLPRIPVRTSQDCLEYMNRYFGYMTRFLQVGISPAPCWKLQESTPPCNVGENASLSIQKAIEFVKEN